MYDQSSALHVLSNYQPANEVENQSLNFICQFVEENELYWSRKTLAGHLTASAWITDRDRERAVLLHHKKLNIWVQPGGHIDEADEGLLQASYREAMEETGVTDLTPVSKLPFDVDVHRIPARKSEPEHWHLDIRFWFKTNQADLNANEESHDMGWFTKSEIEALTDEESVLRMVRKTL